MDDAPETTPTPAPAPASDAASRRYQTLVHERNELRARIKELEQADLAAERDSWKGKFEALSEKFEGVQKTHKAAAAAWDVEKTYMSAGINDPEARDIAELLYNKLPEDGRPSRADWTTSWTAGEEDATPRALRGYMQAPPPPAVAPTPRVPTRPITTSPGGDPEGERLYKAFVRDPRNAEARKAWQDYKARRRG